VFALKRKWRPSLAFVLGGALVGTLGLALVGLVVLRYLGPEIGFLNAAAIIAAVIASLTALCGLLLVRLLLRPVRALSDYATQVRAGHAAHTRPPAHFGTRELRSMAGAVIEMAEAFKTREATIRSYSDHVTHELKTPVSAIMAASEMLLDQELEGREQALVAQIAGAAKQMNEQLDGLRRVVRAREVDYRGQSTLGEVADPLRASFPSIGISVHGADIAMPLSDDGLRLVLDHMIDNAVSHGASAVVLHADGDRRLEVRDNGPGLQETEVSKIFEPLYTTRREAGGTGMGLAIVRNVLAAHGARIRAVPDTGGARFTIEFS
jgi:two-component system OmpR family sensor kinase